MNMAQIFPMLKAVTKHRGSSSAWKDPAKALTTTPCVIETPDSSPVEEVPKMQKSDPEGPLFFAFECPGIQMSLNHTNA